MKKTYYCPTPFLIEVEERLNREHHFRCHKSTLVIVGNLMDELDIELSYTQQFGYCITMTMDDTIIRKLRKNFCNCVPWHEIDIIVKNLMFQAITSIANNLNSFSSTFSPAEFVDSVLVSVKPVHTYDSSNRIYISCCFEGNRFAIYRKPRKSSLKDFFQA